jgi:aerobic-type carbon monoxide dehydrogenase small subunit (CoxS/CutS family)
LSHLITALLMLAQAGARNRAISDRISWNICRDTAIWAI